MFHEKLFHEQENKTQQNRTEMETAESRHTKGRLPFVPKNRFVRMKCQMERFNSVKAFRSGRNAFEGISLFSFQPK